MRVLRRIVKEQDLVLTKISGCLNDKQLMKYISVLGRTDGEKPQTKQLVDCRNVTCMRKMTVRGATSYAKREPIEQDHLSALLIPDNSLSFGMARAYQTFASEKKRNVEIFKDFDHAMVWLNKETEPNC